MKKYRKGMVMEKSMSAKCRSKFGYLAIATFLLWLLLLYLYNSAVTVTGNDDASLRENYTGSLHASEFTSVPANESSDRDTGALSDSDSVVIDQKTEDVRAVEQLDEKTKTGVLLLPDSGNLVVDQKAEDVKAVEELDEKGKTGALPDSDNFVVDQKAKDVKAVEELDEKGKTGALPDSDNFVVDQKAEDVKAVEELDETGKTGALPDSDNGVVDHKTEDVKAVEELDKKGKTEKNPVNDSADGVGHVEEKLVAEKEVRLDGKTRKIDGVSGKKNDKESSETQPVDEVIVRNNGEEIKNEEVAKKGNGDESSESHGVQKEPRKIAGQRKPVDSSAKVEKRIARVAKQPRRENVRKSESDSDPCSGRYIYVHDIPGLFNDELLKNCWSLSWWTNMCELTSNSGLGPHLPDLERVSGWFATNQFTLEVIFHNRMKQYKCLTKNSSMASAVFVPYYAGLDVARYLWGPYPFMRDAAALDLMKWLREKPEWKTMYGRDHFMVAGRTTWDFMRTPDNESDWGNRLMILPETRNMTMLLIEASPWNYHGFAIPYPTYFHPSKDSEVFQWQNRMRRQKRRFLFSFVGAPRPNLRESIRGEIMEQCRAARRKCKLLECVSGSNKCFKPDQIMKFFQASTFCLQPPGDSYTRRSAFDSILAGCIPVFFHPGSAYAQYIWHLPKDYTKYSVFIPANEVKEGKVTIERVLHQIPKSRIVSMREQVIRLIPKVIYADPTARLETLEDAFDLTIKGVLDRVETLRSKVLDGEDPLDFPEEFSWKHNLFGSVEKNEWDPFFERS